MDRMFRMGVAVTATAWVASVGIAGQSAPSLLTALQSGDPADRSAITGWFCPMHPDVTGEGPSRCTKCGMALIAGDPFDTSDYDTDEYFVSGEEFEALASAYYRLEGCATIFDFNAETTWLRLKVYRSS